MDGCQHLNRQASQPETIPHPHAHHLHRAAGGRRYKSFAGKAVKVKLNRIANLVQVPFSSMLTDHQLAL
jgi:hypothetical protein